MNTIKCKLCGKIKPIAEFRSQIINNKKYYHHQCKKCQYLRLKEYKKEYNKKNIKKVREYQRKYQLKRYHLKYRSDADYRKKMLSRCSKANKLLYWKNRGREKLRGRLKARREREKINARILLNPKKYRLIRAKSSALGRGLGFKTLNNMLDDKHFWWHHITRTYVVAIPAEVHRRLAANHKGIEHRKIINQFYGSLNNMIKNTPQGKVYSKQLLDEFCRKLKAG